MHRSSRLQSTNSTCAPACTAASGVAMKVFDGQSTVSPRTPAHSSAARAAPVQPLNATASRPFHRPRPLRTRRSGRPRSTVGVEDPIPQLVQPLPVAMVEADREAGEVGRDVRTEHAGKPIAAVDRRRRGSTLAAWTRRRCPRSSLPAILERLATSAETDHGAAAARALVPSSDPAEVAYRQTLTSEAIGLLDEAASPTLAGASDPRGAVLRAERGGTLQPHELRAISRSIHVALEARRVVDERADLAPTLLELLDLVPSSLGSLAGPVDRAIEDDGSDLRDSASPLLRRLRSECDRAARACARSWRASPAPRTSATRCRRRSSSSAAVDRCSRFAPPSARACRASSTTRRAPGRRCSSSRSRSSSSRITCRRWPPRRATRRSGSSPSSRPRWSSTLTACVALAEQTEAVDLALAAGTLSRGWRGARVEIADEVRLLGARHPLLDPAQAVPIDLDLGPSRALVISGPNTGGKTVALKTLGLAALLHQCGLRPPAGEATLPSSTACSPTSATASRSR